MSPVDNLKEMVIGVMNKMNTSCEEEEGHSNCKTNDEVASVILVEEIHPVMMIDNNLLVVPHSHSHRYDPSCRRYCHYHCWAVEMVSVKNTDCQGDVDWADRLYCNLYPTDSFH